MSEKVAVPLSARDDEIGVVRVLPHGVRRRDDLAVHDVVGEFEERADEDPVALGALRHPGRPVGGRRQALREEAALGAHRHDHRVLHLLRLHEAQDLGAEILRPVGPAQTAARDVAEAQVHALDAGRIDEDFEQRPGQGHPRHLGAGELEADRPARGAGLVHLEEVRADRRLDQVHEAPQDAVVVEARDLGERPSIRARISACAASRSPSAAGSKRAWNRATRSRVMPACRASVPAM